MNLPLPAALENYFFCVKLSAPALALAARELDALNQHHGVSGRKVKPENVHMTICPVGRPRRLREPYVSAAVKAGGLVRSVVFEAELNSAKFFKSKRDTRPFVLCGDDATSHSMSLLKHKIENAQLYVGINAFGVSSATSHATLLYAPQGEPLSVQIEPIRWQVTEFALIRSLFGRGTHEVVASWPLDPRA